MTKSVCVHRYASDIFLQPHFVLTCSYVTSTSNSYLVTCGKFDLDFLPLFPCHQEQLPILATVIGYSRVAGAYAAPASGATCRCCASARASFFFIRHSLVPRVDLVSGCLS